MQLDYRIGEAYSYQDDKQKFILKAVAGFRFIFACGHVVTDCIFMDMISQRTGKAVSEGMQLELFR